MCANRGGGKVHLGVDSTPTPITLGKECWLVGHFFSSPRTDRKRKYYITFSLGSGPDHKPPPHPFFTAGMSGTPYLVS